MARKARGYRFIAYVDGTVVYHTDSVRGMRDQCVRLLEWKYRTEEIAVHDDVTDLWQYVDAQTVVDWRV